MKQYYIKPEIEELAFDTAHLICDSPTPGSVEDVGYEEWII